MGRREHRRGPWQGGREALRDRAEAIPSPQFPGSHEVSHEACGQHQGEATAFSMSNRQQRSSGHQMRTKHQQVAAWASVCPPSSSRLCRPGSALQGLGVWRLAPCRGHSKVSLWASGQQTEEGRQQIHAQERSQGRIWSQCSFMECPDDFQLFLETWTVLAVGFPFSLPGRICSQNGHDGRAWCLV